MSWHMDKRARLTFNSAQTSSVSSLRAGSVLMTRVYCSYNAASSSSCGEAPRSDAGGRDASVLLHRAVWDKVRCARSVSNTIVRPKGSVTDCKL